MKAKITGTGLKVPEKCLIAPEIALVQKLMPISDEDKAALRESIKRDGEIREPLRGYEVGMTFHILSGFNRWEIAKELNAEARDAGKEPPFPTVKTQTIETADRQGFAIDENRARRQLTLDDKRRLTAWLLEQNPELSDRQIGKTAKVDKNTVAKIRSEKEGRGEIHHAETRTDTKGRKQAANRRGKVDSKPKISLSGSKKGQGVSQTPYKAVAGACVLIRSKIPDLTKNEKKALKKELARLTQDTDL